METATSMILEAGKKAWTIALQRPWSLGEVWDYFRAKGRRPSLVTLSGGVVRVTF